MVRFQQLLFPAFFKAPLYPLLEEYARTHPVFRERLDLELSCSIFLIIPIFNGGMSMLFFIFGWQNWRMEQTYLIFLGAAFFFLLMGLGAFYAFWLSGNTELNGLLLQFKKEHPMECHSFLKVQRERQALKALPPACVLTKRIQNRL